MKIQETLAEGSSALASAGIESAGLDSSLLLAEILNASRSSLLASAAETISETALAAFRGMIHRRLSGECVAYLIGRKEFYGLEFSVNPSVLVPRPETETLVEIALCKLAIRNEKLEIEKERLIKAFNKPVRVLDLCTGSGAIAIALKHAMPELEVYASDISAEALACAQANAAKLLRENSVNFFHGDLFAPLSHTGNKQSFLPSAFNLITSNPPYIPTAEIPSLQAEVRREPLLALDGGGDGLDLIRKIIAGAPERLCPGGFLLLEADPRQMEAISGLLAEVGFTGIQVCKDLSGGERVIGGQKN